MHPGDIPDWILDMSDVERRLCQPLVSIQSIVDVTLGSKRYRGHAATFVQHTDEILVDVLPRLPSEIDLIIVKHKNCPLDDHAEIHG